MKPSATPPGELVPLRQLRWAVRAVLVLGVAASIAANVLHARPNPISQAIAAWPVGFQNPERVVTWTSTRLVRTL